MFELALALLAGIATIAAPCTLPVLPILLGASLGPRGGARPALIAAGFISSFAFVALALGALARVFDFDPDVLRTTGLVLLAAFGVLMIWPALYQRLSLPLAGYVNRLVPDTARMASGNLGGFILGSTLGLIWTPCAGPVLGSILSAIATSPDSTHSAILLVTYAVGAALPMLAIAYGGQAVTSRVRKIARYAPHLQQGFGVVVIAFSVVAWLQYDAVALAWLSRFYPDGRIGL